MNAGDGLVEEQESEIKELQAELKKVEEKTKTAKQKKLEQKLTDAKMTYFTENIVLDGYSQYAPIFDVRRQLREIVINEDGSSYNGQWIGENFDGYGVWIDKN